LGGGAVLGGHGDGQGVGASLPGCRGAIGDFHSVASSALVGDYHLSASVGGSGGHSVGGVGGGCGVGGSLRIKGRAQRHAAQRQRGQGGVVRGRGLVHHRHLVGQGLQAADVQV